jgi:hypothetical protein
LAYIEIVSNSRRSTTTKGNQFCHIDTIMISILQHSTSDKPHLSYAEMIRMAIEQSPNQRLSLNHIYQYISETFPYYRDDQNSSWKV